MLFTIGDWNAKVESKAPPGVTGKSGLGVQNEAGQWEHIGHSKHPFPNNPRHNSTHGDHQMINT